MEADYLTRQVDAIFAREDAAYELSSIVDGLIAFGGLNREECKSLIALRKLYRVFTQSVIDQNGMYALIEQFNQDLDVIIPRLSSAGE